ncbi:ribonuclease III [Gracilaria domingensis]|nr:ribonuclease III [Gracilaria domingensis]
MHLQAFVSCSRLFYHRARALGIASSVITSPCYKRRLAVVAKNREFGPYVIAESHLDQVESILQHKFDNRALLAEALTHRSVLNPSSPDNAFYEQAGEQIQILRNNERLELLGDRVFGLVVVHTLFNRDSNAVEGKLSPISHNMVSRKSAREHSMSLGLNNFLLENEILRGKDGSRYGDSFEALLGALFLDGGYDAAFKFYSSRIMPEWDKRLDNAPVNDCKKRLLQEYLVQSGLPSPSLGTQIRYVTTDYEQEQRIFTRAVKLFGRQVSEGKGITVQAADQAAASILLSRLKRLQGGRATCFLIRLAREAADEYALAKLQQTRSVQVASATGSGECLDADKARGS